MEERGPIQVSTPGLLGLLQLKADGRGVPNLSDVCIPNLDMLPWWLRGTAEIWALASANTLAAGGYGGFAPFNPPNDIAVPNGEWWFVHDYTCTFSTSAANTATNVRLAWASTAGAPVRYAVFNDDPIVQVPASTFLAITARNFWIPPGGRIGFYVDTVTGAIGLVATVTQLRFSRCKS